MLGAARPGPGPPTRGLARPRPPLKDGVLPKKCWCTQSAEEKLFSYMAIISSLNHGFMFRSAASLTGTKPGIAEVLVWEKGEGDL